jgi:hypothetical protein
VREWALALGRGVDPDALATIVAAADHPLDRPSVWTADDVVRLVWIEAYTWCEQAEVPLPAGLPETLWVYLAWLDTHALLASGSDPLAHLQHSLCVHAGLGPSGRPAARPAARRRGAPAATPRGGDSRSVRSGQSRAAWGNVHLDPENPAEVLPWRP